MNNRKFAVIGGTGFLENHCLQQAMPMTVTTPYGAVVLLALGQGYFLQRHGWESYILPHAIPHKAHLTALQQIGVSRLIGIGSVGSLHLHIPPGTFVVPHDLFAPQVHDSLFADARGHRLLAFDRAWRQEILNFWSSTTLPTPLDQGVYWQTTGPRFETPAEIRFHQPFVDVVGMTIAAESLAAAELDMPYAAICLVDNYANGSGPDPLTFDGFKAQVRANQAQWHLLFETFWQWLSS